MSTSPTVGQRALAGLLWTSAGSVVQATVQLAALVVLARLLDPSDFGLVGAAALVVGLADTLVRAGVTPAIVRENPLSTAHLRVGFTLSLMISLAAAGIIIILAPVIARGLRLEGLTPVLRVMTCLLVLGALGAVPDALAQRKLRFRELSITESAAALLGYTVVGIGLALLHYGVWALVAAQVSYHVARSAMLIAIEPHPRTPSLDLASAKSLLGNGGGFSLARVANFVALKGDNFVVARWLGASSLGLYERAYQLMAAPATLVGGVLERVLFPTMVAVQERAEDVRPYFEAATVAVSIVALPIGVFIILVAPELVTVVLGSRWDGVVLPLQILTLGFAFRSGYKIGDSTCRALGAVYRSAVRHLAFALIVVLGALIGQRWGVAGVASGVLFAILTQFVLSNGLALRLVGSPWSSMLPLYRPGLAVSLAVGAPVALVMTWLRARALPDPITLAGGLLAGFAAPAVMLWALPMRMLGADNMVRLRELTTSVEGYAMGTRFERGVRIIVRAIMTRAGRSQDERR